MRSAPAVAHALKFAPSTVFTRVTSSAELISDIYSLLDKEPKGEKMKDRITDILKKHRIDIIVISTILIVSLSVLVIFNLTKKAGTIVRVEIDGEVTAEYSIYQNGTYPLNGGTNVLVIENGKAYLNYSDCPDHTCEKTGKIRYVGESIVCLPNKVSITITGESLGDGTDFVS